MQNHTNINDGFIPSNAITAAGIAYNDTYRTPNLGVNNVQSDLAHYDNVAAPGFTHPAVQEATVTPTASGINGGINPVRGLGNNGADYLGYITGNLAPSGISYDQNNYAPIPLRRSDGVYPTTHASAGSYTLQDATAFGYMTHASNGHAANGTMSSIGSAVHPFNLGSVGDYHLHHGDGVYQTGYANTGFYSSNNASAVGMNHGSNDYATNGTTLGAQLTDNMPILSSTHPSSALGSVDSQCLQRNNAVYPTGHANASSYPSDYNNPTAIGMAHGSNDYATAGIPLGADSTGTTPTLNMSSTPPPSTPGSVARPNGHPRWPCTTCGKNYSRKSDMKRHAKKHSGKREFQCDVAGCKYKGSDRKDKLEQHRHNRH